MLKLEVELGLLDSFIYCLFFYIFMVGLRKGTCYTKLERAYTRKSKFKSKAYIRSVPNHKIQRFEMGNKNGKYNFRVMLVAKNSLQIRHNSLESARMIVNRQLSNHLGANYFLRI